MTKVNMYMEEFKMRELFKKVDKLIITDSDGIKSTYTKEDFPDYLENEIYEVTNIEGDTAYVQLFVTGCQRRDTRTRKVRTSRIGRGL